MPKQSALFLPSGANNFSFKLINGHGLLTQTVFTAGVDGSNLKSVIISSDDVLVNLRFFIDHNGGAGPDFQIGTIAVTASAGVGGTVPSVDLFNSAMVPGLPIDSVGKRYLPLMFGDVLKVAATVAVTAAKTVTINCFGEDY